MSEELIKRLLTAAKVNDEMQPFTPLVALLNEAAAALSRPAPASAPVPDAILEIGRRMIADAKDNDHCTAHPMFCVEKRRIVTGIDTDYTDDIAWIDDDGHILDADEAATLEAAYDESGEIPDGYTRTGYVEEWEHVDTYLTPQAAEARINGGKDGRVNVNSAYRNSEMRAVRDFLMALAAAPSAPSARESGTQECMTHGAAVPVVPKAMYDQLMSNYITLSNQPVAQGGGVDAEKVMALVEAARLLGHVQAKKLTGDYTEADSHTERAMHEAIAKHSSALLASPAGMGWIAAGERLPSLGDDVLVYCRRRNGAIEHTTMVAGLFDPHRDAKRPVWMDTVSEASIPDRWEVTHWQPLPLPPAIANQGEGE